jgi:hypothetical protein
LAWSSEQAHEVLRTDLDPEFVRDLAVEVGWQYADLHARLAQNPALDDAYRDELFGRQRGDAVVEAMARVATVHGVPFNMRRLECNGQAKLLVKAGRVVIIQEPFIEIGEAPRASFYKRQLADLHGIVRQLELDLGDQPHRIHDWSGCVLAVLLHGQAGPSFTREHRALGGLMLGVPDAAYGQWILRVDLHQVAMLGGTATIPATTAESQPALQPDRVIVALKSGRGRQKGGD